MIQASLARRYAKAFLQIGIEDSSIEKLEKELDAFGAAVQSSPDLANLLGDPTVLAELKKAVLKDIVEKLGLSEMSRNFIALLGSKGRISAFPEIQREFRSLADAHAGRARATVTSAEPISAEVETALTEKLSKMSGRKVQITKRVDRELLGGIVAEIAGVIYDGSLRTQLRAVRDSARR